MILRNILGLGVTFAFTGARIVRIATHPEYQRMGYGSRALHLLQKYYQVRFLQFK